MKRAVSALGLWVVLTAPACGPSPAYEPEVPEAAPAPPAPQATPPAPPGAVPAGAMPADPAQMQSSDGTAEPPPASSSELPANGAPPPDQWTVRYPTGQWVYANDYGWMWIPNEPRHVVLEETPYVYLYTPVYGWTWYVSPWGRGPYRYGVWVVHPWRPVGWRYGWVARPGVVVHLRANPHVVGPARGGRPAHGRRR